MPQTKPTGPGAAARKYDLIFVLRTQTLSLGKRDQRMVLGLITLLTARYNWVRDELCVGQREIARMWSCNERMVKHEMARMRALGWLVVKQQDARGRMTRYGVDIDVMLRTTKNTWDAIGPDFSLRQETVHRVPEEEVVPFPGTVPAPDLDMADDCGLAKAALHAQDATRYWSWLAALTRAGGAGGRLILRAQPVSCGLCSDASVTCDPGRVSDSGW